MMLTQIHCCYFFIKLFYIDQILFVYGKTMLTVLLVYIVFIQSTLLRDIFSMLHFYSTCMYMYSIFLSGMHFILFLYTLTDILNFPFCKFGCFPNFLPELSVTRTTRLTITSQIRGKGGYTLISCRYFFNIYTWCRWLERSRWIICTL